MDIIQKENISLSFYWKRIPSYLKVTFLSAIIIGILVHGFMLSNKLPNHDDLGQLFDSMNRVSLVDGF